MATVTETPTKVKPEQTEVSTKPKATVGYFAFADADELIVLPLCDTCGREITDFEMGLFVVEIEEWDNWPHAQKIQGRPTRQIPSTVRFVHKGNCDKVKGIFSGELTQVFKLDQRSDFDKRLQGLVSTQGE